MIVIAFIWIDAFVDVRPEAISSDRALKNSVHVPK
jgi:hypothetical protein